MRSDSPSGPFMCCCEADWASGFQRSGQGHRSSFRRRRGTDQQAQRTGRLREYPAPLRHEPDQPSLYVRPLPQQACDFVEHLIRLRDISPPRSEACQEVFPPLGGFVLVEVHVFTPQEGRDRLGVVFGMIPGADDRFLLPDAPQQALQVAERFRGTQPSVLDCVSEPLPIRTNLLQARFDAD